VPDPSPGNEPPGVSLPLGFFSFEIDGLAPGGTVSLDIIAHASLSLNGYFKYGHEIAGDPIHWFQIPGTAGTNRLTIQVTDGQASDTILGVNDGKVIDPGAPAAIDPIFAYMTDIYQTVLGRAPDHPAFDGWVQFIESGHGLAPVAHAFWESSEHRGTQVDQFYATYLHRQESAAERIAWVNAMLQGLPEASVVQDFLSSPEYSGAHPSNAAFIDSLYADALGRQESPAEEAQWVQFLQGGGTRPDAVNLFLTSTEGYLRVVDTAFSNLLHVSPQAVDPQTLAGWTFFLQFTPGVRREDLEEFFVSCQQFLANAIIRYA